MLVHVVTCKKRQQKGGIGSLRQKRAIGGRLTDPKLEPLGGRRTSLAQQHYRRQTNPHPLHITSTLYRKYGRLLPPPRRRQGRLSLRTSSSRTTDPFGLNKRRIRDGARRCASHGNGRWEAQWSKCNQLTCCAQQLAIGVLSTMFGGVFLLSGGSSKAVQQSPPIKASSRGEEDFIQYVTQHHMRHHPQDTRGER